MKDPELPKQYQGKTKARGITLLDYRLLQSYSNQNSLVLAKKKKKPDI